MAKIQTFDTQEKYVGNLSHPDSPGQPVCLDFPGVNRTTTQQLKDCPSETAKRNSYFLSRSFQKFLFPWPASGTNILFAGASLPLQAGLGIPY